MKTGQVESSNENTGLSAASGKSGLIVQRKLTIGAVNNPLEHEADALADTVMRMPEPNFIQRKCPHCEDEEAQRKPLTSFIQKKESATSNTASDSAHSQIQATKGGGSTMAANTKSFMESRFGTDFSNVRIHSGSYASQLSKKLNAQAFTVGNDIYFNDGKFSPGSSAGKRLLAHELTHTIQQNGGNRIKQPATENISVAAKPHIAKFTDDAHRIIDEAALTGGGFSKEQIAAIEKGNKLRDYSQLPRIGNAVLLCDPGTFGGYGQDDHFDNYIWDKDKKQWRDRSFAANQRAGLAEANVRGSDPIAHIKAKFSSFITIGGNDAGLEELGNGFHAVEDFFAHSNFVELINEDFRFGHDLLTGSVPGTTSVSLLHTLGDVSAKESAAYYKAQAEKAKAGTDNLSHANIAKDHLGDRNHIQARRLAALIVQDISRDLLQILKSPRPERLKLLQSVVFAKIDRYLGYPDVVNDAWWIKLTADDNGVIDQLLSKAQKETPATVNQCVLSPLRNLEASKDSNMKIILGAAIPVNVFGHHGFVQVGGGLVTPFDPNNSTITPTKNDAKTSGFIGGQITIPL
jgi:hypothetical protein